MHVTKNVPYKVEVPVEKIVHVPYEKIVKVPYEKRVKTFLIAFDSIFFIQLKI